MGRLTIICWMRKSSALAVKSMIWPSLEPFLVSTLRVRRSKLRPKTCSIRTTSEEPTSSSTLSMTMPYSEYSRMDLTSRMFWFGVTTGPVRRKAMIWRLSGSTMGELIWPMGPPAWTLKIGVPVSRELYTNIILL